MKTIHTELMEPLAGLQGHPANREIEDSRLESLKASIQANGIIEPIQYREVKEGRKKIRQILHGHRRSRAAELLGLKEAPMIKVVADDESAMAMVLVGNIEREDLNPAEEAEMLAALAKMKLTPERIAELVARDISYVQTHLALAVAPVAVRKAVGKGKLPVTVGITMAAMEDRHKKEAEQEMLRLAEGYSGNQAFIDIQMKKVVETVDAKSAWVAGMKSRIELWKTRMKAEGWNNLKVFHRGFDEPLDHKYVWGCPRDEMESMNGDVEGLEKIITEHSLKQIGDMANHYQASVLIVPRGKHQQSGWDDAGDEGMIRVNLDSLVAADLGAPEESRWLVHLPPEEPEKEDPDAPKMTWQEKQKLDQEKRATRESEVMRVLSSLGDAVRLGDKATIKAECSRSLARQIIWNDAVDQLDTHAGEYFFPNCTDDKERARLVAEWAMAKSIGGDLQVIAVLAHLFSAVENMKWRADSERLQNVETLATALPASEGKDQLLALVAKLREGEL